MRRRPRRFGLFRGVSRLAVVLFVFLCAAAGHVAPVRADVNVRSVPREPAPPLDGGIEWINTSQPITLPQLRGKIVILDFWTYCCINCLQTLPDLKQLEQAYPNELVVIGVHAPKFFGERDSANIREAIVRHDVQHPVVNDANAVIAQRYGISSWPSLRVIDPEGFLIAAHDGEATFKALDAFMKRTVAKYRRQGVLDDAPLRFDLEQLRTPSTALRFPGKVLADAASGRLFVADSGHHRIVIASLDGKLRETVGTGAPGRADGTFEEATFSSPQGLALRDEKLYVADTENHMVRQIDLRNRMVTTLAGTGEQAEEIIARATRQPTRMRLASPWDLWTHDDELFIAMAGSHQLWRLSLTRKSLSPFAGNGREDIVNGPALSRTPFQPGFASFAQPSGLTSDGQQLYVADSEGGSIRAVTLQRNAQVSTVLGTADRPAELRLFTFGDQDGPLARALLQHPLAVAYWQNRLFVADTYNNKIKQIDLDAQVIRTVAGDGQAGDDDTPPRFNEPAGLSVAGERLFVADTNNHLIRVVDLSDNDRVSTLEIEGLSPPEIVPVPQPAIPPGIRLSLGDVQVAPQDGQLRLAIKLYLPADVTLNPDVPMSYVVTVAEGDPLIDSQVLGKRTDLAEVADDVEILLPLARRSGETTLELALAYFYCEPHAQALCKIGNVNWTAHVILDPSAKADRLKLEYAVR